MTNPLVFSPCGQDLDLDLAKVGAPLALDRLAAPAPEPAAEPIPWEMEIGYGKGRYLLSRAAAEKGRTRFLGVEIANRYFRHLVDRGRRRGLGNLVAIRGEALYLLAAILPRRFARTVHVYHPDPWPKSRHQKRRLLDPESLDLVLGALEPGGSLAFETDHLEYGESVAELLAERPGLAVERLDGWPDGPRTHYEAKYVEEGRPILRLVARLEPDSSPEALHPRGASAILVGPRPPEPEEDEPDGDGDGDGDGAQNHGAVDDGAEEGGLVPHRSSGNDPPRKGTR